MEDIYYNIFTYLSIKEIYGCMQVCISYNEVCMKEILWNHIYFLNYRDYELRGNYYETCRDYYCIMKLPKMFKKIFPDDLKQIIEMTHISLSHHKLQYFPIEICLLDKIKVLYLECNDIKVIPTEIMFLTNLIKLNLISNDISIIPTELCKLNTLEELYLNNHVTPREGIRFKINRISKLPLELCNLTNLKKLNIKNNFITVIPTELSHLSIII